MEISRSFNRVGTAAVRPVRVNLFDMLCVSDSAVLLTFEVCLLVCLIPVVHRLHVLRNIARKTSIKMLKTDEGFKAVECTEAKKHCWYFEGLYPTYYICRSYEDCCGSRCCVRALSIQRLWFLLMMGVLFCCGAGFFIRRRMYPPPLVEEPTFNVSYTRQPVNTASGSQQPGVPYYTDPGGPVMNPMAMAFHVQPNSPQGNPVYPPPPSYCNTPPPPYEQVVKSST
nr:PREDICTED: vesicular, overexpressed in cancer, prosurvival protein 1 [Pelecanus crispus]